MFIRSWVLSFCLSLTISLGAVVQVVEQDKALLVKTEYGDYFVAEPVLVDLIKSPAFKRLQHIHQYGVCRYVRPEKQFTRYEHCLGVFVLLRHYGASLDEQIAGLLHDVSHTVFSHVGDFVFNKYYNTYSYQDDIHEWYLQKVGIMDILQKYGFGACCSEHAKKSQRMLEQDKPNLCMDRIEYLLRGGLADDLISQDDVKPILDDLYFENQQWVFKHADKAKQLALVSLWLSENIFGTPWNLFIYTHASEALLRAVDLKLMSVDDIHFSVDDVVWQQLNAADDALIKQSLDKVIHYKNYYKISNALDYDLHFTGKCLGVDPWVEVEDGVQRLSAVDAGYGAEYKRVHALLANGWYLKLVRS